MMLIHLILAHLLGDFVFQSNRLIQKKFKNWFGVFQHVAIVSFFNILFMLPYWRHPEAWLIVGIIFVLHFAQDLAKVNYEKRFNRDKKQLWPFFLDQVLHLSLILLLTQIFPLQAADSALPMDSQTLVNLWAIGAILVTYTWDITVYQFARRKKKELKFVPQRSQMLDRLLVFSVLYLIWIFFVNTFL